MAILVLKGAIFLIGRIKVFSKAIMLGNTLKLCAALVFSLAVLLFANNLFVAAEYLFDFLCAKEAFSFLIGPFRKIGLAVAYSVCMVFSVALIAPLKLSKEIWFHETSKKNRMKLSRLFYFYRPSWFFKSVWLYFSLLCVKFLWLLLYFFPCAAMSAYLVFSLQNGISKTMLLLVSASIGISFLSGSYFSFVTFQRYDLCYILYYENTGISPFETLKLSAMLMDEHCFKLAKLKLSFLPWMLSCALILPAFYVYPYYKISVSYFRNNILSNK